MLIRSVVACVLLLPALAVAQVPGAVSVEPMAVSPGQSATLVVHGTGLQGTTSLWTNLDARITRLAGSGSDRQRPASAFKDGPPLDGTLIIEAEDYDRGTWGRRPPFILNAGGGKTNTAEWDVEIPAAANFVLELRYASGDDRPVKLSLNGTALTRSAASTLTGGFGVQDARWIPECVLSLRKGTNTIRMERSGGTPHFDKLALVPTSRPATAFAEIRPTDRVAPYRVDVPAQTPVGVRGLRIATGGGISNMLLFMVDDLPTTKEINGMTAGTAGQVLELPAGVEGYCDSTHADRFAFEAASGQELSFEVVAQRLGTSLDPVLKLLDDGGRELAFVDDTPGLSGDCWIRYRFAESGTYFVTIQDALTGGSSRYRYRLRIGDFPLITTTLPAAVQSGTAARVAVPGQAVNDVPVPAVEGDEIEMVPVSATYPGGTGSGFTQIAVSQYPQHVVGPKSRLTVSGLSGVFSKPGEIHHCSVDLREGQKITLTDRTRSRGLPALVAMSIADTAGQQLAAIRKAGPAGQSLAWVSPAAGQFTIAFSELTGRGGAEFGYYVEIENTQPDFSLVVEKDSSILPQNGYAIFKVTAERQGYTGPIQLSVSGPGELPTLSNAEIPEKAKETRLKIHYPAGMKIGQTRALEIVGTATIGERSVRRKARTEAAFHKAMPQTTFLPAGLDGLVALSIGPEIPDFFGLSLDGGAVLFPRLVGEVYFTVRVKDRAQGFREMVKIRVDRLPAGFNVGGGDRAVSRSDNNEYRFQLRGPSTVERSSGHVRIVGEATFRGQTKEVELARVPFRVIDPLLITAAPSVPIQPGNRGRLVLRAKRFVPRAGGDKARVVITFDSVPDGVTLPAMTVIPAGQNDVDVSFSVAKNARLTSPVRFTARTVVAGQDVVITATAGELSE